MSEPIDPDFRPRTYFRPQKLDAHLLSNVTGSVLRKRLQELFRQGRTEELRALLEGPGFTDEDRQALESIHPMFMGGNYLPDTEAGEVEIARITLRSTTFDVTSVFARMEDGTIHYRVVDEYGGDTLQGAAEAESAQPMSLRAFAAFVLRAWPLMNVLESNFEDDADGALAFFQADSEYYPDLNRYLRAQVHEHFEALRADDEPEGGGDTCPVCGHFNSPPAGDLCEHACGWEWDGQFEPLGAGEAFASGWSKLAALAFGVEEDSTDDIVLRAHARRNPLRAALIELAGQDVPLGQVLERLAQATPGGGWSTGGMLGGSGHGWYVPDPKRLDQLAAECQALNQACALVEIEVGEDGTDGLEVELNADGLKWELAIGGRWEEDMYHSGYISYFVATLGDGRWVMQSVQRNGELDGVTQEDVDEGHLNDDQIQAMWGMTLEEAQAAEFTQIAAMCSGASPDADALEIAEVLYRAIVREGGMEISEPDGGGLLDA